MRGVVSAVVVLLCDCGFEESVQFDVMPIAHLFSRPCSPPLSGSKPKLDRP